MTATLAEVAVGIVPLSLASLGGGPAIIVGLELLAVHTHRWITPHEFLHLFAISRAAPGPGTTLATLIGQRAAGWNGALVASAAIYLPSSLLCYAFFRLTNAHRGRKWHAALRQGLAPVGTGLILAGAWSLFRLSGGAWTGVSIALGSFLLLERFPRMPAILVLGVGAVVSLTLSTTG